MSAVIPSQLKAAVVERLGEVIDSETSVDGVRMRLVEDIVVDRQGLVSYTFRPSSPLCPVAVSLITQIKKAVAEIPGIAGQEINVIG